jgi:hypothetical protein
MVSAHLIIAMSAAAPEGTPPRWINNFDSQAAELNVFPFNFPAQ